MRTKPSISLIKAAGSRVSRNPVRPLRLPQTLLRRHAEPGEAPHLLRGQGRLVVNSVLKQKAPSGCPQYLPPGWAAPTAGHRLLEPLPRCAEPRTLRSKLAPRPRSRPLCLRPSAAGTGLGPTRTCAHPSSELSGQSPLYRPPRRAEPASLAGSAAARSPERSPSQVSPEPVDGTG